MNITLLALLAVTPFSVATAQDRLPQPTAALQSSIRAALDAGNQAERTRALEPLRANPAQVVPELFHFTHAAETTRDAMAFGLVAQELRLERGLILRGTVPFLEATEESLRTHAGGILSAYEDRRPDRDPDLAPYRAFLETPLRAGTNPPAGLTRYLVEASPGQTLLLFARISHADAEARRPYLWAEHVLDDLAWRERHGFSTEEVRAAVDRELRFLVESEAWWARLVGIGFLERHPSFQRKEWARTLASDPHPYVRQAMQRKRGATERGR